MNKDQIKGAVDQAVGSVKSHVRNLTGDTSTQIKGAVQQIKGQVETAVGNFKDAVHDANQEQAASDKTDPAAMRKA